MEQVFDMDFGEIQVIHGKDGKDGVDGKDGENGASAYEIAVQNGFEGTEEEWLESLKGEKGDSGSVDDAVLYTPQDMSPEKKAQARANIGAVDCENALVHDLTITTDETDGVNIWASPNESNEDGTVVPVIGLGGLDSDEPVRIRNIADGIQDTDAVNKKQLDELSDSIADVLTKGVEPRSQVRQIYCRDTNDKVVNFIDVYVPANWSYDTSAAQYRYDVFGLEAYGTSSTAQRVFHSKDGGETWSEYCSLPMDAASGQYYSEFAVDYVNKCIYLLRVDDGVGNDHSVVSFYYYEPENRWIKRNNDITLTNKRWLTNNSFEICRFGQKMVAMFGEYGTTTDGTAYCLWRTANGGVTWNKVLEIVGDDNTSGTTVRGEIRHWHTVKADPYTQHIWAAAGDTDPQCKIFRSTDGGENWEIVFSGSQRERTCGFVFEEDCIYYGMDAKHGTDPNFTRIVKIDKSKLDTDRENSREDVAVVDSCRSVYGLTRTFYPDGFIVWTQQEPDSAFKNNQYTLQFFDYATKKLYPIARFDISNISTGKYIGFYAGAKCQLLTSGVIFARPTNSMHQEKYGFSFVSRYIKINLTM